MTVRARRVNPPNPRIPLASHDALESFQRFSFILPHLPAFENRFEYPKEGWIQAVRVHCAAALWQSSRPRGIVLLLLILPLEPNCCCCCYWSCRETRLDVTPKPRHLRDHIPRVWNASGGELSLADIQAMADPACHSERDAEAAGHYKHRPTTLVGVKRMRPHGLPANPVAAIAAVAAKVSGAIRNDHIIMVSVLEFNALGISSKRQGIARRCCCCCDVTRHIFSVVSRGPVAHVASPAAGETGYLRASTTTSGARRCAQNERTRNSAASTPPRRSCACCPSEKRLPLGCPGR